MSKDYCGIFLEGVSRVFESSLINAPYDKTVVGTIVEDFQSAFGKYIVSYQGTNYSASPRDSGAIYAKNDTVYLVKQANLDQYMILGKKITQADLAVQVVNPYTKYARLLDYKPVSKTISVVDNKYKYTFPTWQINTNEEYDTITISGGFKTIGVTSYRFIFNFTTIENKKYEVTLSESEILGATNSGGFINRKHLFDIAGIGKIKAVDISLTWEAGTFELDNLVFELGINLDKLTVDGDRLEIYTNDALTYLTSTEKRTINTKWIYTNEDEKSVVYTHLNTTIPVGYEVRWYRAQKDSTDMYAGDGWTQIATNQEYPFRCILENLSRTSNEQIKLIILKLDTTTSTIIPIESNVLEFINETISETEELYDLRFNYGVGNSNVYALWDLDGVLKDPTQENKKYKVDLKYKTAYSNEELNERLRQGVWRIPASCLRFAAGGPHSDGVVQEAGYSILTRTYTKLDLDNIALTTEEKNDLGKKTEDQALQEKKTKLLKENIDAFFSIQYSPLMQYKQDSIEDLQVEIYTIDESKVYELSTQLVFTKESDDGTGYSMTVRFKDGVEVIATALQRGKTYNVEINVYDANSQPVFCNPTWEIKELDESGNRKTAPELFTKENAMIKVKSEGTTYYYASLIVTAKVTDAKLKKEVPIALTSSGELKYSGPIEIVYDAAGKIKNFNNSYLTILNSNFEELNGTWSLIAEKYQDDYYYPKLNKFTQGEKTNYRISPYEIFESTQRDNYGYALEWTESVEEGTTPRVFYQPIIIRQATSFSPLIDDWDGKFKIDENTGTVMSSVMIAGNKDNGSFSGVILGEISKTGGQSETGILGYHEGSQSYGFLDNGTAFIGKSGAGRIEFNGTDGIIQSSKYTGGMGENDGSGTYLNLRDGTLISNKLHLRGKIEATSGYIGGTDTNAWIIGAGRITSGKSDFSQFIGLYSKNLSEEENPITINGKESKDWRIIAGTKFGVTSAGDLFAANANITGIINATSGYIGGENGWTIDTGKITSGDIGLYSTNQSAWIGNNPVTNLRIKAGDNFGVSSDGILYATSANITGVIHADEGGTIASWVIGKNSIIGSIIDKEKQYQYFSEIWKPGSKRSTFEDSEVFAISKQKLDSNGSPIAGTNTRPFWVSTTGILHATGAEIQGTINATNGWIGQEQFGWKIDNNSLINESLHDTVGFEINPTLSDESNQIFNSIFFNKELFDNISNVGSGGSETGGSMLNQRGLSILSGVTQNTNRFDVQYTTNITSDGFRGVYQQEEALDYLTNLQSYWNSTSIEGAHGFELNVGLTAPQLIFYGDKALVTDEYTPEIIFSQRGSASKSGRIKWNKNNSLEFRTNLYEYGATENDKKINTIQIGPRNTTTDKQIDILIDNIYVGKTLSAHDKTLSAFNNVTLEAEDLGGFYIYDTDKTMRTHFSWQRIAFERYMNQKWTTIGSFKVPVGSTSVQVYGTWTQT